MSKRIVTLRRKGGILEHLKDAGCRVLERKQGIEIDLNEYDLDIYPSERWKQYAEIHEKLWIEFSEEAVRRADVDSLRTESALTKHEFATALKELG